MTEDTNVQITEELKRLSRRIESIAITQDKLFSDREILEDILSRLSSVETALKLNRASQTENAKDIRAGISGVKDAVENKIDEVSETIEDKTVIVKGSTDNVVQKIINKIVG